MLKLGNPKNAIWEALLLTVVVFILGLLFGVAYEESRLDKIEAYYAQSEVSLMDIIALNSLIESEEVDCKILIKSNIKFADKIYEEARLLERYEDAGKVTDILKLTHKKYDLLRTFLWVSSAKTLKKCQGAYNNIVYLYEYEPKELAQKANQGVWSKILFDLKQKRGSDILLIPIAIDSDLESLNSLIEKFKISKFPVIIINNGTIITELKNVEELEKYLI